MSPLLTTLRERLSPIWASVAPQLERGRQWLTRPRGSIDWKAVRTRANAWILPKSIASRTLAVVVLAVVLVAIIPWLWKAYSANLPAIIPLGAGIGGAIVAWAALAQAATARRRHEAQTGADLQRRITESFSKATEQLGSDKIEVRLGGIYTLERISRESPDDYWTVMETLCAFVRERARWKAPEEVPLEAVARFYEKADSTDSRTGLSTDIAAAFAVIARRREAGRMREKSEGWRFDFRETDLRIADFDRVHLEGANFRDAHLEGTSLMWAHLESADFQGAHLEGAVLAYAHLEGASFVVAHLQDANLAYTHLDDAWFTHAHLEGATLYEAHLPGTFLDAAHLEGVDLSQAYLKGASFQAAIGDAKTRLPDGFPRPPNWPPYQALEEPT